MGTRFSTYATTWIRASALNHLKRTKLIHVPDELQGLGRKIKQMERDHEVENGGQIGDMELAEVLAVPVEKVRAAKKAAKQRVMSYDAQSAEGDGSYLDTMGSGMQGTESGSTGSSLTSSAAFEYVPSEVSMLRHDIDQLLSTVCSPDEHRVVRLRYGLEDGVCRSQRETGSLLGISKETVRQMCIKAFGKIQNTESGKALLEYLD